MGGILTIEVVQSDITNEVSDAIVNAANSQLEHGKGVAGAISKRAGPDVQNESNEYVKANGRVPTGEVVVTGPGELGCRYVLHAVGPIYNTSLED